MDDSGSFCRRLTAVVLTFALTTTLSGCAFAPAVARIVTLTEVAALIDDLLEGLAPRHQDYDVGEPAATTSRTAHVAYTDGDGVWLNNRPGAGRIAAYQDGTEVEVFCVRTGPEAYGPHGATKLWYLVSLHDGKNGYMTEAHLSLVAPNSQIERCG